MTILAQIVPPDVDPHTVARQTASDLDRMADILTNNGWHQHDYYDRDQVRAEGVTPARARVDMYGALNIVLCDSPVPLGVLTVGRQHRHWNVVRAVADRLGTYGLYAWQKVAERTEADVLDALTATAKHLRGGAS